MDKMKLYTLLVILIMLFMVTGCSSKENLIYSLEDNYYWASTDDYYVKDGKYYFKSLDSMKIIHVKYFMLMAEVF